MSSRYEPVIVHKGRTNILSINVGFDVSDDTLTSQIRAEADPTSTLIATWVVSFKTDGVDGELVLTLDDAASATITHITGYMDVKRVSAGEPLALFEDPIPVVFKKVVTV